MKVILLCLVCRKVGRSFCCAGFVERYESPIVLGVYGNLWIDNRLLVYRQVWGPDIWRTRYIEDLHIDDLVF